MLDGNSFLTQGPLLHDFSKDVPKTQLSQVSLLVQKRIQVQEIQSELDAKKEEFRERMRAAREKELDLAARQEGIRDQVRKFEKFLRENDAKKSRANRKTAEEIKSREQKEQERLQLEKELAQIREQYDSLTAEYKRFSIYENFLDRVCQQHSEYFDAPGTILQRFETLDAACEILRVRVAAADAQTNENRTLLHGLHKRGQTESLVYKSQVSAQRDYLEEFRDESKRLEAKVNRLGEHAKDNSRQLGQILMTIENLYQRAFGLDEGAARKRAHGPVSAAAAASEERHSLFLAHVQQRIADLQAITAPWVTDVRKRALEGEGRSRDAPNRFSESQEDGQSAGQRFRDSIHRGNSRRSSNVSPSRANMSGSLNTSRVNTSRVSMSKSRSALFGSAIMQSCSFNESQSRISQSHTSQSRLPSSMGGRVSVSKRATSPVRRVLRIPM